MNQREIKFRAWDKERESMFTSKKWVVTFGGEVRPEGRMEWNSDQFILEQFTGLKDKNGKEIYEGDVVRLRCGGDDGATARHKILAEVKWHEDRFVVSIPDKVVKVKGGASAGKMLSWREIHTWCGMHTCLTHGWGYVEVIGNIHENPKLLTP